MNQFNKHIFLIFLFGFSSCLANTKNINFTDNILSLFQQNTYINALQLPGMKNLEIPVQIDDLLSSVVIYSDDCNFFENEVIVKTTVKIGWMDIPVDISLRPSEKQTADATVLFSLPDGWKLSGLLPALGKLDLFVFKGMKLLVSSSEYKDTTYNVSIEKGANLFGMISLSGPLSYVSFLFGNVFDQIYISGLIKPDVVGSTFKAYVPGILQFIGGVSASDLEFLISIDENAGGSLCEVGAKLLLGWSGQDLLEFNTSISFGPNSIDLQGSMDGKIKNLFGVNGVHAGDWFVGATIDKNSLTPMVSLISLSDFTVSFDLDLAGKKVNMVSKIGVPGVSDLGDLAFEGKFDGDFSLSDCIHFVGDVIKETPYISETVENFEHKVEGVVPDFVLGDVYVFFSPKDVIMGGVQYSKGLIVNGVAQLFGSDAYVFVDLQEDGMKIVGYLEELDFGPLKITGAGYDRIDGTHDDGLILDAVLGLDEQHCYVSGQIEVDIFGGISSDVTINVSKDEFSFSTEQQLFDMFDFGLLFSSKMNENNIPFDFHVKGYMYQNALTELQNIFSTTAHKIAKQKMLKRQQSKFNIFEAISGAYNGFWNLLADLVGNTFNIKEFSFESKLSDLVDQTKLPRVTIKGIVFGKEFELHDIEFDISDPIASAKEIIESISDLF